MSFVALATHNVITYNWPKWGKGVPPKVTCKVDIKKFNTQDTYLMIFNNTQQEKYNAIINTPGVRPIYQSIPACNYIHPGPPRNFVLMFEYDKPTKQDVAQPVPEVPTEREGQQG